MPSPFRIDVFNATGVIQGSGPITNATELHDKRRLDQIGEATFILPAADPRNALITAGSSFDLYDEQDGYLGRFYFSTSEIRDRQGRAERVVKCHDALIEFSRTNVGFRRGYHFEPVNQVVEDLVNLASGWRHDIETGIGNTSVTYEGESVFAALDVLRDRWGRHFRLSTTPAVNKQLDFGSFGEDSGVVIANLEGQIQAGITAARNVAIVSDIRYSEDGDWVVNRAIPIGAGQGEAAITIHNATLGDYAVVTAPNKDGTTYAYIEDTDSQDTYGVRPRVVSFTGIRPISNNATDILRAQNATKLAAEAYLLRHLASKVSYDIGNVVGLRVFPKPGDLVRLVYKGATEESAWIDVNALYYLIEISRRREASGDRSASLSLSSTADQRTSDRDVMVDVVRDVKALKLQIQPYPYRYEIHERDNVGAYGMGTGGLQKRAQCRVKIASDVTDITKVVLNFRTAPLFVYAQVSFTFSQNWFDPVYSINYPSDLRLYVNNVDVTSQYAGPWAPGGLNVETIVEDLDITDLLKNAAGGLYQEHLIEIITNIDRVGDTAVPGTSSVINGVASTGEVFFTVLVQGTAQAIISS